MNPWKKPSFWIVTLSLAFLFEANAQAQQDNPEKPIPVARVLIPLPDLGNNQQEDQQTENMQPDTGPASGFQSFTLGTSQLRHSYWVPGFQYGNTSQSGSTNPALNSGWITTNYLNGNISMLEAWSHNLLSASYSGGGFFSQDKAQGNGQYHQLAAAFEIEQRRWQALFVDEYSYLPQSSFGFGGTSGLSFPGITGTLAVPLPGLQNAFIPGQSVLTAVGPRYSNASAAQLTFELSKRGSFTVGVVHGLLRFHDSGNIDSDTEILNAGYDYLITKKDTIGFNYRFSAYHFPSDPQALGDHVGQLVYGRRITGRVSLHIGGGPEITTFRLPVGGSTKNISGAGSASLIYSFREGTVQLNYMHGVTNGSGFYNGAVTDMVIAAVNRRLNRVWDGSLTFGYAENRQVLSLPGITSPTFGSWVPGMGLHRPWGKTADLTLGYQAQIQTSNLPLCSSMNCGTTYMTHQVLLSFQWHASPQVLR